MSEQIICEHCGYSNSKHRNTCKNCRGNLPQAENLESSADTDIIDSSLVPSTSVNQGLPAKESLFQKFLNEDQDSSIVQKVVEKVSTILTSTEEILYIAVQKKPIVTVSPDCIVITNRRFIHYQPKILGRVNFEDHIWRDLRDAKLQENMMGATISFLTVRNQRIEIDYLPKQQARIIYSISQEMEEYVREERRNRDMEEKRAASGGVFIQNPIATENTNQPKSVEDPVEKLSKLKKMLEIELITEEEYQKKKMDILDNL
ncbi:MAG: hypothetical protein DHS20C20_22680 [Ardenticatenaceae bacterium]|nr:MAG: hypothetical protein DHS20C20_22680 [Ardenticatenaceae bacterium]